MADRSASVDFNANVTGYTQSLTQAIAVTDQYSVAADNLLGRVAKLGGGAANTWIQKTNALTQANKTATAQAAAYQQKLSGLESTAKILGEKTFPRMEKATKALATTFPVGIGQAVEQMKALQETGVTNISTAEKLGVSFTKLGGATGSFGPELGKQMTELTRSMGNSLSMADGMGDSLTVLTKKYGGTASGVLAFSKSIAPIAATVGMSQTQVMGLSTAFSRLGEDGFAAGNALNKVLIDLNRSVRDGTPELRTYAEVMNKSTSDLRAQFQADPSSVLVDFTTAINAQGPNAIRILDKLGLEGVRTTKALTSLSREGNLGEIITDASSAFGGGAATSAAETAFGGVNDQVTRLNESMSQMTASAGKPLLGILEGVLGRANSIVELTNDVVSSKPAQTLGGAAQLGGGILKTAGGLAMGGVQTAMTLGLGFRGARFAAGRIGEYYAGQNQVIAQAAGIAFPQALDADSWMGRRGQAGARSRGMGAADALLLAQVAPNPLSVLSQGATMVRRGARRVGRDIAGLAEFGAVLGASDMRTAMGQEKIVTRLGSAAAQYAPDIQASMRAGDQMGAARKFGTALKELEAQFGKNSAATGSMVRGFKELAMASGSVFLNTGRAGTSALMGTAVGKGTVAGVAALGVGAAGYSMYKNQKEGYERLEGAQSDPYREFNKFAEKAGYATRQVTALGDAAASAAKAILGEENTTTAEAVTISTRERALITSPDYKSATDISGAERFDAMKNALMNPTMKPEELGRIVADAANTKNEAYGERVGAQIVELQKAFEAAPVSTVFNALKEADSGKNMDDPGAKGGVVGFMGLDSEREKQIRDVATQALEQLYTRDSEVGGAEYGASQQLKRAEELYNLSIRGSESERDSGTGVIKELLGLEGGALASSVDKTPWGSQKTFNEMMLGQKDSKFYDTWLKEYQGEKAQAKTVADESLKTQREADASTEKLIGVNLELADVLGEGNKRAGSLRALVGDLDESDLGGMSKAGKAITRVQQAPLDQQLIMTAGREIAEVVLTKTEGSVGKAMTGLIQELAVAPDDGRKASVLSAMEQLRYSPQARAAEAAKSPMQSLQDQITAGARAQAMVLPENSAPEAIAARTQDIAAGQAAWENLQATVRTTAFQVRDSLKAMGRAEDDYGRSTMRSKRDFGKQLAYAAKDHLHTEFIANRDFRQSMKWSDQDFHRQRTYTKEDFARQSARVEESYNRQVSRAEEDRQRQVARAQEDYQRSSLRAEQDYQRNRRRATESFERSMLRAEEDYYRQRGRMIKAYDLALSRQIEDNAKAMYSPYERMMHNRVQDLNSVIGNLKEQNQYLEAQAEAVDKLKAAGMTQETVDMLDLSNPENLQQTLRIANDATQNPALIEQANAAAAARAKLSKAASTDTDNVDYRRSQEDLSISLAQMAEDQSTATARATQDFNISMSQAAEDFTTSVTRAAEEFNIGMARSSQDFTISMARGLEDFTITTAQTLTDYLISLKRSDEEYSISTSRARKQHDQQMTELDYQYATQLKRQKDAFSTSMADAATDFGISMARMNEDLVTGLSDSFLSNDAIAAIMRDKIAAMPADLQGPLNDALDALIGGMNDLPTGLKIKIWSQSEKKWVTDDAAKYDVDRKILNDVRFKVLDNNGRVVEGTVDVDVDRNVMNDVQFEYYDILTGTVKKRGILEAGIDPKTLSTAKFDIYNPITGEPINEGSLGIEILPEPGDVTMRYLDPKTEKWQTTGAINIPVNDATVNVLVKWKTTYEGGWEKYAKEHGIPTGGADITMNGPKRESDEPTGNVASVSGSGITKWTGGAGRPGAGWYKSGNWTRAGGHHNGVDVVGVGVGTGVRATKPGEIIHAGPGGPEGSWAGVNVIQQVDGAQLVFAHLSDTDIRVGQDARPGQLLGNTGYSGRVFPQGPGGAHLHVSARKGGTYVNPTTYLAQGGIATRQMPAMIAEAGYPEMVLPLNERGAKYLAQVMARYVSNDEVKGSKVAPYATSVTIHNTTTIDQSTKVLGPVTVEANDPNDFGRQMAAKARRDKLVQPVGSRR